MKDYIVNGVYTLTENVTADNIKIHGRAAIETAKYGYCFAFAAITSTGARYGYNADTDTHYQLAADIACQDLSMFNPRKVDKPSADTANIAPDGETDTQDEETAVDVNKLLAENEALRAECEALKADIIAYQPAIKEYDEYANIIAIIRQSKDKAIADVIKSSEEKIKEATGKCEELINRINKIQSLISGE